MAFGEVDDECDGPIAVGAVVRVGPLLHGAFGFYEQKVEPIDVERPNSWRKRNLWLRDRIACTFGTLHVGIYCGCDLLAVLRRYITCTRVQETNSSFVICDFELEDHMHCTDESGI